MPKLQLDHLRRLTDGTGLLQHAIYAVANRNEGYCTDDNARALELLCSLDEDELTDVSDLPAIYASFIWHAFDATTGRFHNFLGYDRTWKDDFGSEDCQGRALRAMAAVLRSQRFPEIDGAIRELWGCCTGSLVTWKSPRAWAMVLIALCSFKPSELGEAELEAIDLLGTRLGDLFDRTSEKGWTWFEDGLTYANPLLPHGAIVAGAHRGDDRLLELGLQSLKWLCEGMLEHGHFVPVGCNGFHRKSCARARYDQQPIEATACVLVARAAWGATQDPKWIDIAEQAYAWFGGKNDLGLALFDPVTGGCRDGLHETRLNENQGAESTLAYLMATAEIRQLRRSANRAPAITGSGSKP